MVSPIILLSALVVIIIFVSIVRSIKRGKNVRREFPAKDEGIFAKDETTFGTYQTPKITTTMGACKTCNGTKKIKCRFCHGFGSTRTTKFGHPTTIQVSKTRPVFGANGKVSYQHYTETQTKPGKIEYINQSCGPCRGSGKVKCPDCS